MNCKNCGAELFEEDATDGVLECEYCFTRYTVPKKSLSPAALEFLRIGEHDLDAGRFDDAYAAYEKAASLDGGEPEAQFGMALSLFKVQYLKDEVNSRLQAICNEITDKRFQDDSRFLKALNLASDAQRAEYQRKAEEIDYIRGEFYKLKASGLDFDCFLCVKVTDANGEKTEDSKDADYIYDLLKDAGYKPFYSERNIRNRTGADYEAMILYALQSAESMLVICRKDEYLQTPWVKNEYMRFLRLLSEEEKERDAVTIVYHEKPIERLMGKRGKIQGIDFSKREADRRICAFVESHTFGARGRKEEEDEEKKKREDKLLRELEEQKRARQELEHRINALRSDNKSAVLRQELNRQIDLLMEQDEKRAAERKKREEEEFKRNEALEAKRKEIERRAYERENDPSVDNYNGDEFVINDKKLTKYRGFKQNVLIPRGLIEIGNSAFENCYSIKNATVPNGVVAIGDRSFQGCKTLISVILPDSVTSVGAGAFSGCARLQDIRLSDSVSRIGNGAFFDCTSLKQIAFPNSMIEIGENAFNGCLALKQVTIPNSVTAIGKYAFRDCKLLENVMLPRRFEKECKKIFRGCKNLAYTFID